MSGYTKLFSSILTSTVWCEDAYTRVVWVAMMASKDRDGIVEGSIPGFARVANVTVEQMEKAVQVLCSPDVHSRTPDHEGRRIECVPGGWRVLNHDVYRDMESSEHRREKDAERQQRHRERKSRPVTPRHAPSPHADAEAKANADNPEPKPSPATAVGRLQEAFRVGLEAAEGPEAKFNYGQLGGLMKRRLKDTEEAEIVQRMTNWFASTDPWVVRNRNLPGVFDQKFHQLKGGPMHAGKGGQVKPSNSFQSDGRNPQGHHADPSAVTL